MALFPKRVKYRKHQRGTMKGLSCAGSKVSFGEFGLKALGCGWMTAQQIEACRVLIARQLKKGGKLWIRVFPDKSVSKKPQETRMGKGKGEVDKWVAVVRRGRVLFELAGVPENLAKSLFRQISYKLPFKTKFVKRIGR